MKNQATSSEERVARQPKEAKGMKNTNGHRWTDDELKLLMKMWTEESALVEIAAAMNSTVYAVNKMVQRLRSNGIPLKKRTKGNVAARAHQLWTQAEVEYLIRRRKDRATAEEIAHELGRTYLAVNGMIQKLRSESVTVPMLGSGVRKLWSPTILAAQFNGVIQ